MRCAVLCCAALHCQELLPPSLNRCPRRCFGVAGPPPPAALGRRSAVTAERPPFSACKPPPAGAPLLTSSPGAAAVAGVDGAVGRATAASGAASPPAVLAVLETSASVPTAAASTDPGPGTGALPPGLGGRRFAWPGLPEARTVGLAGGVAGSASALSPSSSARLLQTWRAAEAGGLLDQLPTHTATIPDAATMSSARSCSCVQDTICSEQAAFYTRRPLASRRFSTACSTGTAAAASCAGTPGSGPARRLLGKGSRVVRLC